jgi:hypothetical protein
VVDVPDEGEVRQQVGKRLAPRGSALHPWLEPALTSCEKVDESLGRHRGTKENKDAQSDTEFPRPEAGMKRGDLKPAYARWSSEEESVRVALLRSLVWTAGSLDTSLQ